MNRSSAAILAARAPEGKSRESTDPLWPACAQTLAFGVAGLVPVIAAVACWESPDLLGFGCYLAVTLFSSTLSAKLPGMSGTMSANFLLILVGITQMSFSEAVLLGCIGSLVQCLWKLSGKAHRLQISFNTASMAIAVAAAYGTYHWPLARQWNRGGPVLMGVTALVFFILNTGPVAAVISRTGGGRLRDVWRSCYSWSLPLYLLGASFAWMFSLAGPPVRWQSALILLPAVHFIYQTYRLYLSRLESEREHGAEMAALHMRTIEALALAIEAKDHTTHEHLARVSTYAVEIGRELGLSEHELDALRAASLLHDIGKLAVPEHIISKPGRLTPEEFEKMKIHPMVGAEILERVNFPYPVVPIVLAHHERWDGSGYPFGLKGEQIPIGARILAAVDCFDALSSDRHYRRALPIDEAIQQIRATAGKALDPEVVQVLERRYPELERAAKSQAPARSAVPWNLKTRDGAAPAAGFESGRPSPVGSNRYGFLSSIAAARAEVRLLFELARDVGTSLDLDETLSVVALRVQQIIPYDAIAIYIRRDDMLAPEYVNGEAFRLFSSLEIRIGEGLSGWVAQNDKPILNGNPALEQAGRSGTAEVIGLRSALAVPLAGVTGTVGVLTLYRNEENAFSRDHLRILLAAAGRVSLSIENALKFRQVENSATTDYLTDLPNARSLFLHMDSELARCRREGNPLAVLVCDLDGFKAVNDRYGHLEGNDMLRRVARCLRSSCREYDYVARMGGDEFVLLLPATGTTTVPHRLKELEAAVRAGLAEHPHPAGISLSLGVAVYPEDGSDAEQLLAEADRRMYETKQKNKKGQTITTTHSPQQTLAAAG